VNDPPRWTLNIGGDCIGSGLCLAVAGCYFERATDGRSRPVTVEVDANDDVLDAAACCPAEAITVTDRRTGRPVEA